MLDLDLDLDVWNQKYNVIFLPATSEKKDDCVIKFDVPNPHTNKFAWRREEKYLPKCTETKAVKYRHLWGIAHFLFLKIHAVIRQLSYMAHHLPSINSEIHTKFEVGIFCSFGCNVSQAPIFTKILI